LAKEKVKYYQRG